MTDTPIDHIATVFPVNAEALKPERKFHRRRSIIREFSLNTSTHGIPGIARSESIHNRIFWTVSLLIFTGIMIYFITESIKAYFNYPTQTLVSVEDEWPQPFPAVSICNYSPLRYDTFIEPFLNYTNSRNLTNTNKINEFSREQANYIRDFIQYQLNNGYSLNDYLFSLKSMLIKCNYNGINCTIEDFTPFLSPYFGYCYTFNGKNDRIRNGTLFDSTENGGVSQLELQIYLHSHQYVPYFSDAVGLMALLHDNREMPLVHLSGISFAPGKKHRVTYTKKQSYLLESPYSSCSNKVPYMLTATFAHYGSTDYAYTQWFCYTICLQRYIYATCGCIDPLQWDARSIVLPGTNEVINAPLCNLTDPCYGEAADRFRVDISLWEIYCSECQRECSTISFITRISSLSAPMDWMMSDIKKFVESSSIPLSKNWSTNWQTDIEKNYVALQVQCETTLVENYTQNPSISWVDVVSNVGGHTGLWIGISFLSIMELVEMLYRLIRYHCHILRKKLQTKEANSE